MTVDFDEATRTATMTRGSDRITHVIGTAIITVNGSPNTLQWTQGLV
jgi:hypothetical protein